MRETKVLLVTLKDCLKKNQLTYRDVAKHLALSEASIKRLFCHGDLSLERLEQILELMDMRLIEFFALIQKEGKYISVLTSEQEKSLISQPKLLLIFFLLLNGWALQDIYSSFNIEHLESIQLLAKLDKLRLIELLPNNRVKLLTASNFSWHKNSSVQKFFEEQVLANFFKDKFKDPDSKLIFMGGMLSDASFEKVKMLFDECASKINDLMREDLKLPLNKRFGIGSVLALRRWELPIFSNLRKK
ncbi:MAG: XRE family transcriptional regulator [Gammaproteobacteria bacterium]|jgi:glycerophosphoryl diester phosphodiesterase|nr:XRE family transcriptional regulator [Gammaproteobacteria bacterium]